MLYVFIPVGLIFVFLLYSMYLVVIRKDYKTFKSVFYPGIFFILLWIGIYYILID